MQTPKIDNYRFGEIVIDGRSYSCDVVIYPDHVDGDWWRAEGHSVALSDLWEVMESPPAVLVIGQGSPGRMDVPDDTRRKLEQSGIELFVQPTSRACTTYNQIRNIRRVVAALHLTC